MGYENAWQQLLTSFQFYFFTVRTYRLPINYQKIIFEYYIHNITLKSEPSSPSKEDFLSSKDMADQKGQQTGETTESQDNWITELDIEELIFPTLLFVMIVSSIAVGIVLNGAFQILTEMHQLVSTIWNVLWIC